MKKETLEKAELSTFTGCITETILKTMILAYSTANKTSSTSGDRGREHSYLGSAGYLPTGPTVSFHQQIACATSAVFAKIDEPRLLLKALY